MNTISASVMRTEKMSTITFIAGGNGGIISGETGGEFWDIG
jgi:hypothetical protein